MSLSKIYRQNLKNILFFFNKQIYFFSTFRKYTVGGFVSELIKKLWPKCVDETVSVCRSLLLVSGKCNSDISKATGA